jgi:co-chaperonin GroES (HSP10)
MSTDVASNELIELYKQDDRVKLDSNGERRMTADDCFILAARLVDQGMYLEGACPLVPFGDQLVVRVIHETNRTSGGGVHLLDTDVLNEVALRGVILAVGPKVKSDDTLLVVPQVGDIVLFSRHAGIETVVGDKRYLTMRVSSALTKVLLPSAQEEGR